MMDRKSLFDRIAQWGSAFSPEMIGGTQALYAPLVRQPAEENVVRDQVYGPDARHKLDLFRPAKGDAKAPVLLFVHGGGFVMGDKGGAGAPFYNNVGHWAAEQGFVGATMTYRLAPASQWPSGREDLAAAVEWLAQNVGAHGGDPARIFVMGQSAGATHVADFVAEPGSAKGKFAGGLMISGIYDIEAADRSEMHDAYFGRDYRRYAERSTIGKLAATDLPCLYALGEYDPPMFQQQASALVAARVAAKQHWPEMHWLAGHNHLSTVTQMGSDHDTLGPLVADFIARHG
jgi:triacylglycerol lipase